MSHLDEGQLHAYLDSQGHEGIAALRREIEAHLAACAQCRVRLDEERRVRDRANAILRAGSPGAVAAPPFEEIARRRARVTPRRAPRTMVLAWAATVALALGLGWYARSLAVPEPAATFDISARPIIAQAPAPAAPEPTTTSPATPPGRRDLAPPRELAAARAEPARQLEDRPAQPAPTVAAAADTVREADTRLNTRDLARDMVQRVTPAAGAGAQPARMQPVAAAADEALIWVPVNRAEAERRLDDQLAALPDLETLGITLNAAAGVPEVRTVQRLADGRTIELIQQRIVTEQREAARERAAPAAAERLSRAAAQPPPATAVMEWRNSRVTARGPLPADSLRALLQLLRRAQPPEPDQLRHD